VRLLNQLARERLKRGGELGEDDAIATERGERHFASADRVLFLRNERSLGVKNGSLGRVESVTAARITVLLDDGRSVGFDLKDYAAVDHGYAATIHKAQGMTVDRVQVLATPGLDRHASYVALSRHREAVELHYGRDDFADHDRLAATLSRERSKDLASDYTRSFAGRREIRLPVGPARETPRRSIFDGLRLSIERDHLRLQDAVPRVDRPRTLEPRTRRAPSPAPDRLAVAVTRHGHIVRSMLFSKSVGDLYTPEQRAELRESRAALDALQPHGRVDLEIAFANDRRLIGEAAAGRTTAVIRAMQLEGEMRGNPQLRADVFVQRWQALDRQCRSLREIHETTAAGRVADRMIGMAKSLERDPQVDSILRNRRQQLGLPVREGGSIGRELGEMLGRGRSRGLGIGM
jgi:hypothetical protein